MKKPQPLDRIYFAGRMYVAQGDAGAPESFQSAQHQKPWRRLIAPISKIVARFRKPIPDEATSRQGSGVTSPSTVQASNYSQRYERRQVITDARLLELTDIRVKKAVSMYAREATRGGAKVKVQGSGRLIKRAQAIADETIKLLPAPKLAGYARMLVVEGDLFVQAVVAGRQLMDLARLPAESMERLTDDADQFVSPEKAFAQVDTLSNATVAEWPQALMCHLWWDHVEGERYGNTELFPTIHLGRNLDLLERAQAVRRMARSSLFRYWKFPDDAQDVDIKNFMATYGMVEGERDVWNPNEVARDIAGKGIEPQNLDGDPNIHQVDDLRYFDDLFCAGLPTPKSIYGRNAEAINRDVLKDQRAEWLKDTSRVSEALEKLLRFAVDLNLMLNGIDPGLLEYSIVWSRNSAESEGEQIQSIIDLRSAKLVSRRTAVAMASEYTSVENVEDEIAEIDNESKEDFRQRAELMARRTIPDPADERELADPAKR